MFIKKVLSLQINMKQLPVLPETDCCGCGTCEQICPQQCTIMQADQDGFLYPQVNAERCVGCAKCEKACPVLHPYSERNPLASYAAINPDEYVRMNSSSGGVFTLLAEQVISKNGYVFAARFDDSWNVVHDKTNDKDSLYLFRGSKYVQSCIGHTFRDIRGLLNQGISVLFVGTPCQVAGLNHFLGKQYEQLLTVDFICHGVPSPAVWQWYIQWECRRIARKSLKGLWSYLTERKTFVKRIDFRNKVEGWKRYHTIIETKASRSEVFYKDNPYMQAFLNDMDLRPSCHQCKMKEGRSHSDITIADFWNVHKVIDGYDDDKGTSLVLVNSEKGADVFSTLSCRSIQVNFPDAIHYNPAWRKPYPENPQRQAFMKQYKSHFDDLIIR